MMVSRRRRLLDYLKSHDSESYKDVIQSSASANNSSLQKQLAVCFGIAEDYFYSPACRFFDHLSRLAVNVPIDGNA